MPPLEVEQEPEEAPIPTAMATTRTIHRFRFCSPGAA
jgi:hypothetical protein